MTASVTRRAFVAFLWVVAGALFVRLAFHAMSEAGRPTHGFAAYWTAPRLLLAGEPAARLYDEPWFDARVLEGVGVRDGFTPNPPTLVFLTLPIAPLPYAAARAAFLAASLLALALVVWLLERELRPDPLLGAAFAAWVFACRPVRAGFAYAQAYVLVALLLTLALVAARRRRDAALGGWLAAMLVLKAAAPSAWLFPLLARRWRALAWGAAIAAAAVLVSLPLLGGDAWRGALASMARAGRKPGLSVVFYQSFPGLFRRLFGGDAPFSAHPLLEAPRLGAALAIVFGAAALLVALRAGAAEARALPALAVAGLLAQPLSGDYHYALAIPAVAVLLFELPARRSVPRALLLAGALALLVVEPRPPGPGLRALASYPFVAAGVVLLSLLASRSASEQTQRRQTGSVAGSS